MFKIPKRTLRNLQKYYLEYGEYIHPLNLTVTALVDSTIDVWPPTDCLPTNGPLWLFVVWD